MKSKPVRIKRGCGNIGDGPTFRVGSRVMVETPLNRLKMCMEHSAREPGIYSPLEPPGKMNATQRRALKRQLDEGGPLV